MKRKRQQTFAVICEAARGEGAQHAWNRARLASGLRHAAVAQRRHETAKRLGELKARSILRALDLAADCLRVGLDESYQVGMVSVTWQGRERLHLPPASRI